MKILMVHNDYGRYSGEEAVVDRLVSDCRKAGFEVREFRTSTKDARGNLSGNIRGFFSGIYSIKGVRQMREALRDFKPDIVHVHNLYPFISPAALFECRKAGVKVIMTVHNYRLICPTGLFLRNGLPCEECLQRGNEWGCIKHNCEGSRLKTLGYTLRNSVARLTGAYKKNVDYFCCLTEFQKRKLIEAGFEEKKMKVFPNYIEKQPGKCEGNLYVGYVGRLSHEKGFDLLVEVARRHPEIPFRFAGELREEESPVSLSNVEYCGQLNQEELERYYKGARFLVLPSRCYEGFPLVIPEAFGRDIPVIGPSHGPFPDLIQEGGLLFEPNSIDDLESKVVQLWNDPDQWQTLRDNASSIFSDKYSKEVVIKQWQEFLTQLQKV